MRKYRISLQSAEGVTLSFSCYHTLFNSQCLFGFFCQNPAHVSSTASASMATTSHSTSQPLLGRASPSTVLPPLSNSHLPTSHQQNPQIPGGAAQTSSMTPQTPVKNGPSIVSFEYKRIIHVSCVFMLMTLYLLCSPLHCPYQLHLPLLIRQPYPPPRTINNNNQRHYNNNIHSQAPPLYKEATPSLSLGKPLPLPYLLYSRQE